MPVFHLMLSKIPKLQAYTVHFLLKEAILCILVCLAMHIAIFVQKYGMQ